MKHNNMALTVDYLTLFCLVALAALAGLGAALAGLGAALAGLGCAVLLCAGFLAVPGTFRDFFIYNVRIKKVLKYYNIFH